MKSWSLLLTLALLISARTQAEDDAPDDDDVVTSIAPSPGGTEGSSETVGPSITLGPSSNISSSQPSLGPSLIPSGVPDMDTMVPSSSPTVTLTPTLFDDSEAPTEAAPPPIRPGRKCQACTEYETMDEIAATIASIMEGSSKGRVCVCPKVYDTSGETCPEDDTLPALNISSGQNIILECFTGGDTEDAFCVFACPGVIASVGPEAQFKLVGNNAVTVTGGSGYSRMVVEEGGLAIFDAVDFRDTAATLLVERRRQLVEEERFLLGNTGQGGAIAAMGNVDIAACNFTNCSAQGDGGAIWAGAETANLTILDTGFLDNTAGGGGGAIFSNGFVYVEQCEFDGNVATDGDDNIGGNFVLDGCENVGLGESPQCPTDDDVAVDDDNPTSAAAATSSSSSSTMFLLLFTSVIAGGLLARFL